MTKILVIEDEPTLRDSILELLDAEGFDVVGGHNGRVGIELAQALLPDLIICDILMPEMDGHEVLSRLRCDPETALIPFIFLTAKTTEDDLRQGMNLGADDYLVKPYTREGLLKAIATRLTKHQAVKHLQDQVETLERSNELKDDFLSAATDELRAPLTNMMMSIKMLRLAPSKERQQRYIELLQAECSREMELINDLLDLQRLETGDRPLRLEALTLQTWLPHLVEPLRQRAQERQQVLRMTVPPYLPVLMFDQADLKQILTELLTNACKYTEPKGTILLEVYRAPHLGVADTAPSPTMFVVSNEASIPTSDLPKVFEKFYRVPGSDRSTQGGSGLGLTLVKQLVERSNGSIQVSSDGGWTQVTVQLPARPLS